MMAAPRVVVFPRLVHVNPVELPRKDIFGLPGRRSPVMDPIYLLGTRDYRSGLPARFIHWKASARHQRLQEKIFDPSEQEKVLMAVDVQSFVESDAEEALERTLEVAASVAVQIDRRGSAFGFACNAEMAAGASRVLPVAGHRHQISALLELLAHIRPVSTGALKTALTDGFSLPWGTSALVFAYGLGPSLPGLQNVFTSHKIPVVLAVYDVQAGNPETDLSVHGILPMDRLADVNGLTTAWTGKHQSS
jgi:uncharacterized protein (DUF58 family)